MKHKVQIKNLRELRYFLSVKVIRSKKGVVWSQQKNIHDLLPLTDVGMLGYKHIDSPMDHIGSHDNVSSFVFKI